MGGFVKKGPKHKRRRYNTYKDKTIENRLPTVEELEREREKELDEFRKMMEDAPSYKRHNGAYRQVK
jgi:hypothetical protein